MASAWSQLLLPLLGTSLGGVELPGRGQLGDGGGAWRWTGLPSHLTRDRMKPVEASRVPRGTRGVRHREVCEFRGMALAVVEFLVLVPVLCSLTKSW